MMTNSDFTPAVTCSTNDDAPSSQEMISTFDGMFAELEKEVAQLLIEARERRQQLTSRHFYAKQFYHGEEYGLTELLKRMERRRGQGK